MSTPRTVIDRHLKHFFEGDLDGILSDYAPGAVMFLPDGPIRGVEAIGTFFRALLDEFGKPGARFDLEKLAVDGDYGYIVWKAETADNVYEYATDTFAIRDGRIAVQSFAGKVVPKR